MAVGFRSSSQSGASDTFTGSCTIPVPSGAASGDIAVLTMSLWASGAGNPTVTWPSGFTECVSFASGDQKVKAAWKRLTAGDTGNYVPSWTPSHWNLGHCVLITGAATTGDAVEATNTAQATGTTMPATSLSTVTQPFLVYTVAKENSATNTPPTGFTELHDGTTLTTSYQIPGTTGTHTTSGGTISASTLKLVALIAVKAAGGGSSVTGAAVGSFGFASTAAGVDRAIGQALASLGFTATTAGVDRALGVAAASFGFTAASLGVPRTAGSGAAALGFTGSASGTDRALGVAVASFGFTATAQGFAGTPPVTGAGLGVFGFTATTQGQPRTPGAADTDVGFIATGVGRPRVVGLAVASFGYAAAAVGRRSTFGFSAAALGYTGTIFGLAIGPVVPGTAHPATGSAPAATAAASAVPSASAASMTVPTATGA